MDGEAGSGKREAGSGKREAGTYTRSDIISSSLSAPCSLLPAPCSLLPAPCSLLAPVLRNPCLGPGTRWIAIFGNKPEGSVSYHPRVRRRFARRREGRVVFSSRRFALVAIVAALTLTVSPREHPTRSDRATPTPDRRSPRPSTCRDSAHRPPPAPTFTSMPTGAGSDESDPFRSPALGLVRRARPAKRKRPA